MRWPLVSRARHDKELDKYHELLMAAYDIIADLSPEKMEEIHAITGS